MTENMKEGARDKRMRFGDLQVGQMIVDTETDEKFKVVVAGSELGDNVTIVPVGTATVIPATFLLDDSEKSQPGRTFEVVETTGS